MPAVAVRTTALNTLTARQRRILRLLSRHLELGQPAAYRDPATNTWAVFDHHDIPLLHVAVLGCLAANWGSIPADYDTDGKTREQIEDDVRAFLSSRLKWPLDPTPEGTDPYAWALQQQNTPASVQARTSVPSTWSPVDA